VDHPILFYDGVCGLCDRAVQFVLRHDHAGRIRFAPLQSELARDVLARQGRDAADLDSMYLGLDIGTPRERLLTRSDGVIQVLRELGGPWRWLAAARLVPHGLRDPAYDWVVRHRYRWFGRHEQCVLPRPEWRERFLDTGSAG
jgi:predicted DCC family thiol-disulfide oxidoreductase YuxK